jgi:hypothetical protein
LCRECELYPEPLVANIRRTGGVFNSALMSDAVWSRRYEDGSLRYMGVERQPPLDLGLWDTALTEEDFQATFQGLADK